MDNYLTNIVGKGMIFPIQLTRNEKGETGWYPVNGDMALVRNNISSIMYYLIGQRFRQENFGNRLWECIEEPNTQALSFIIKEFIKRHKLNEMTEDEAVIKLNELINKNTGMSFISLEERKIAELLLS